MVRIYCQYFIIGLTLMYMRGILIGVEVLAPIPFFSNCSTMEVSVAWGRTGNFLTAHQLNAVQSKIHKIIIAV